MPILDIESENSEPYEPADDDDDSDDNDHDNDNKLFQRANDICGICESFTATPNPGNSIASIEVIGVTEVIDRIYDAYQQRWFQVPRVVPRTASTPLRGDGQGKGEGSAVSEAEGCPSGPGQAGERGGQERSSLSGSTVQSAARCDDGCVEPVQRDHRVQQVRSATHLCSTCGLHRPLPSKGALTRSCYGGHPSDACRRDSVHEQSCEGHVGSSGCRCSLGGHTEAAAAAAATTTGSSSGSAGTASTKSIHPEPGLRDDVQEHDQRGTVCACREAATAYQASDGARCVGGHPGQGTTAGLQTRPGIVECRTEHRTCGDDSRHVPAREHQLGSSEPATPVSDPRALQHGDTTGSERPSGFQASSDVYERRPIGCDDERPSDDRLHEVAGVDRADEPAGRYQDGDAVEGARGQSTREGVAGSVGSVNASSGRELSDEALRNIWEACKTHRGELQKAWTEVRGRRDGKRILFIELCCYPDSTISASFLERGGMVLRCTLDNGFDLRKRDVVDRLKDLIEEHDPLAVWGSPDCGPWSSQQNANQRAEKQVRNLLNKRRKSSTLVRNVLELLDFQASRGRDAIFEHPLGALSWNGIPELRRFSTSLLRTSCESFRTMQR